MNKRNYTNEQRDNLIRKVTIEGYNIKDAAFICNISYQAATKIIKIYDNTGRINKNKTGTPSNKKVTGDIVAYIEEKIEVNPLITLLELKQNIFISLNLNLSVETIRRVIYDLKITLKRAIRIGENINSSIIKERRKEYARSYMSLDEDKIKIFIDESAFNLHLRRTLGRSVRGSPVSTIVPTTRGRSISLVSGISKHEVIHAKTYVGALNSDRFVEFFDELIQKCTEKNILNSCIFILDNARIHHSVLTKDFFMQKNVNVMYLSPYSYMLNPIEFAFSKIKSIVRRILGNRYDGSFTELILSSVYEITEENLLNYYRHIYNNCLKAIANEDFN